MRESPTQQEILRPASAFPKYLLIIIIIILHILIFILRNSDIMNLIEVRTKSGKYWYWLAVFAIE